VNAFGRRFRLSLFGESHAEGVGVAVDGVPPGLALDAAVLQRDLDLRRPGALTLVSQRKEPDIPRILSGTHRGVTTGAPVCVWIENRDAEGRPYADADLSRTPRPGHADWVNQVWSGGHADLRGGGHSSGRLTAPLVAAGAIAGLILSPLDIRCAAHLHQVHDLAGPRDAHGAASLLERVPRSPVFTGHTELEAPFTRLVEQARGDHDSLGGVVEFVAEGLPVGLGDPFFDAVESSLAHLLFSVPAVKGVEFGAGFAAAGMRGSEHNDPYEVRDGHVAPATNHAGGILGGRTTGAPLRGRAAVKPTSSLPGRPQATVDLQGPQPAELTLTGRHDPCIAIRAVPVVQACLRIVLADFALLARQQGLLREA
jgi:chorismate synthase